MVADVLTKALVRMKHEKCKTGLGICRSIPYGMLSFPFPVGQNDLYMYYVCDVFL